MTMKVRLGRGAAAVAILVTAGSVPAGAADGGPTTRGARAVLEGRRVDVRGERHCQGADGLYRFAHETYEGTSEGDDELTGRFVLEVDAFDNVTQGYQGLATGSARIYDAATGRLKVVARVTAVDSPSLDPLGVKVDGFVTGRILPPARRPGEAKAPARVLFANFSVRLDTSASFVGSLGADVPVGPQNTAVIQDKRKGCLPPEE
jgi:hypothetical protein